MILPNTYLKGKLLLQQSHTPTSTYPAFNRGTIIIDKPKLIKNVISQSLFFVILKRIFRTELIDIQTTNTNKTKINDSK
jgi:hypothetical protein